MEDRVLLTVTSQVAMIGSGTSINGGFLPTSGADLAGITFTNLAPSNVDSAHLASFDTAVLNVVSPEMGGNVNTLTAAEKQALVDFVGSGHKLIIRDSESAAQNYSWLPFPFQTNNPGQTGSFGNLSIVENNSLTNGINASAIGSQTDAAGDSNVMVTLDSHWFVDMTAVNANGKAGPVQTYAEYTTGGTHLGLFIYDSMDVDYMPSTFNPSGTTGADYLRQVWVQEVKQPFDPSGLPHGLSVAGITLTPASGSDTVGGTHTVTATIKDLNNVPQVGVPVTFSIIAGPNAGAIGTTNPSNGMTDANGNVTFTYTGSGGVGTDQIEAQFTNSSQHVITSPVVTETWTQPATVATTTQVSSDANPSSFGQLVTFSASVTPNSGGGTPTGTVSFYDGAAFIGSASYAGGTVSITTSSLSVGTHTIKASFSGGPGFDPSQATLSQVVNQASTTTDLASSANPSTVGQSVSFTATVTSAGGVPTGSVEFFDGANSLGVAPLSGGVASVSTSGLAAGSHAITAVYSGDPDFMTSQGALTQTVTYATTVLGDNSKAKQSGSTLPVKIEVTDSSGINLSSPGLTVTAVGIAPAGSSAPTMPAQDAGAANPGGLFRYDPTLGGYIFNLKLVDASGAGLAAGSYTLFFTIGDDPTLHTFSFSVKSK